MGDKNSEPKELVTFSITIDPVQHGVLQLLANEKGCAIQDLASQMLEERLHQSLIEAAESKTGQNKRIRLQLDFSPEGFEQLNELVKLAQVSSRGDVFRNALRFYKWYLEKIANGYKLGVSKDDERTEVELVLD